MEEVLDDGVVTSGEQLQVISKTQGVFKFTKLTQDVLADKVETFLKNKGYKIEEGDKFNAKYGKGSRIGRILLGAFIKRFAWKVTVQTVGKYAQLTFYKEASGMVGGAVGVHQVTKEFKSIIESLKNFHNGIESK